MPNFQKIIDLLAGALCILDFSHIISGTTSFLILTLSLHLHGIHLEMIDNFWTIVCSVLLAYLAGIISWIIGRFVRKKLFSVKKDFEREFDKCIEHVRTSLPARIQNFDRDDLYTYFWIELGKKSPDRVAFINRFWVMQAMFEGLMSSSMIALMVAVELKVKLGDSFVTIYFVALLLGLILLFFLFQIAAREQARYQIRETILSYYYYCC